nr:hypothetical protein 2 [Desulfobacteraceae bacterium]
MSESVEIQKFVDEYKAILEQIKRKEFVITGKADGFAMIAMQVLKRGGHSLTANKLAKQLKMKGVLLTDAEEKNMKSAVRELSGLLDEYCELCGIERPEPNDDNALEEILNQG